MNSYTNIFQGFSILIRNRFPPFYFNPCTFHFVEIGTVFCLYTQSGLKFLAKLCCSDPSFNRNVLSSLYIKFEISSHAQLRDYSFIPTIYKFHDMVSVGNLHWGYLLINEVYRQRHVVTWLFPEIIFGVQFLTRNVYLYTSYKDDI